MFGELLGAWAAQVWADQGRPDPFVLAELGPGRGTLMRDALRAAAAPARLPRRRPPLARRDQPRAPRRPGRDARRRRAAAGPARVGELPARSALRRRQRVLRRPADPPVPARRRPLARAARRPRGDRSPSAGPRRAPTPTSTPASRTSPTARSPRSRREAEAIAADLGARIARHGGAALVVDYGAWDGSGDTLQAVAGHAPADPLAAPGEADLTAHVRFRALAEAARPARAFGTVAQGVFLERLGITARARALARGRAAAAVDGDRRRASPLDPPGRNGKPLPGSGARPGRRAAPAGIRPDDPRHPDLGPAGGRPARLLHPPRRRLLGHLRRAELRPRLRRTSARRWR